MVLVEALKDARVAILHSAETGGQTNYDTLEAIDTALAKAIIKW